MSKNILIIEDDEMLVEMVGDYLSRSDIVCWHARTAKDAQFIMWSENIDIVLSDWDLGMWESMTGGEVVSDLMETYPDVRYIIWSGLDRSVPDGVEFYLKGNPLKMLETL